MNSYRKSKPRVLVVLALALILAMLISMASFGPGAAPTKVYAETLEYYQLKAGDETVGLFATEKEAYDVINNLKDKYVGETSADVEVKMFPALTVNVVKLPKYGELPIVETDIEAVVEVLSEVTDVTEDGDVTYNEGAATSNEPMINVSVEYETVEEESIPYETIYQEDPEMYADDWDYVLQEGQEGVSQVTYKVTEVNGTATDKVEIAREETVEPVAEIIVYGTLEREYVEEEEYTEEETADDSSEEYTDEGETADEEVADEETYEEEPEEISPTDNQDETFDESVGDTEVSITESSYSGSGQDVVNYALQFVGNPYVWGGISLTGGCDCSGFVYSVFNDMGYNINRWPDDDFPHVSASELKPGDVCRYGGHYAIYIGDGMEISAVNEEQGIRTHPMYYSRSAFMYGIRIID